MCAPPQKKLNDALVFLRLVQGLDPKLATGEAPIHKGLNIYFFSSPETNLFHWRIQGQRSWRRPRPPLSKGPQLSRFHVVFQETVQNGMLASISRELALPAKLDPPLVLLELVTIFRFTMCT